MSNCRRGRRVRRASCVKIVKKGEFHESVCQPPDDSRAMQCDHGIGCHLTQETRVQNALDVATRQGNICQTLLSGRRLPRAARKKRKQSPRWRSATRGCSARQGLTRVPISAQLELTLSLSAQLHLTLAAIRVKFTRGCVPKVFKLSSNVDDFVRRS